MITSISSNHRTFFYLVVSIWCMTGVAVSAPIADPDYWPTKGWRTSTLEKQGMNSDRIIRMLEVIREKAYSIDSITIIRNGYMVLDAYFYTYDKGEKHIIHSCTKSITSAIMGIAIDKGYVKDVDESVLDYFPNKRFENVDERKRSIRIKHLLTMSSGIKTEDNFAVKWKNLIKIAHSDDWVQFGLSLPMETAPGEINEYSNIASFLLTAIIKKSTDRDVLEFAREHLFTPLGINDVSWDENPNGIAIGWGQMYLKPHDMAKFGWLYLNKGNWENQQLISERWVSESTKAQVSTSSIYKVVSPNYGYQWWVTPNHYYMALGYAGQYIIVAPDQNLVAVFTGSFAEGINPLIPVGMFQRYIILSIESDTFIPSNQKNEARLKALLKEID